LDVTETETKDSEFLITGFS